MRSWRKTQVRYRREAAPRARHADRQDQSAAVWSTDSAQLLPPRCRPQKVFRPHVSPIGEVDKPRDHELDLALGEVAIKRQDRRGHDIENHARMLPCEPVDDGQNRAAGRVLATSDPQFAGRRIIEEFDVLHALPEFIECGKPALDDRLAILRDMNSAWS